MTGAELLARRKRLGLSRDRLAQQLGVSPSVIYKWETARTSLAEHGQMLDLALRALEEAAGERAANLRTGY